jgi:16S rRNA (guanine527-N7)-methyltransferase
VKSSAGVDERVFAAVARLCARYRLTLEQGASLRRLIATLVHDQSAPTTIRDPQDVVDMHVADSLVGLEVEALASAEAIADLGSGAGMPGLPLAIALPRARVSLLESQSRKCEFLARAAITAGADNAVVVNDRAEEWRQGIGSQGAVLARALAPPAVVVEYAAPLLEIGGTLVDWRGRREPAGERDAAGAARHLGMELSEIRRVEPFRSARDRHLHIYVKVGPTPQRFPRRAGIARKRPLSAAPPPVADAQSAADRDRR